MKKKYYLKVSEINSLISASPNPRDRIVIKLLSRTGITRSELQRLNISDIDFEKKQLWVSNEKTNKLRLVPVDDDTLRDIRYLFGSKTNGRLISSQNRSTDGISLKEINMITKRCGILAAVKTPDPDSKYISPQLLRNSFIFNAYRAGVPVQHIQQIVGLSSVKSILDTIEKPVTSEVQDSYEKWTKVIESV